MSDLVSLTCHQTSPCSLQQEQVVVRKYVVAVVTGEMSTSISMFPAYEDKP